MKVFISWSGEASHEIGLALREWVHSVVREASFMSSKDIAAGARRPVEIERELSETNCCLVCLTPENKGSPWIHFEAGAVSKMAKAFVGTVLFGLQDSDLKGPLTLFQYTHFTREGMARLAVDLTRHLGISLALENSHIEKFANDAWSALEAQVNPILERNRLDFLDSAGSDISAMVR